MSGFARVRELAVPGGSRVIAVSDVHGSVVILRRLLAKVGFRADDTLIFVGDMFLKGPAPRETLDYIIALSAQPNVFALNGNCDWVGRDGDGCGVPTLLDADVRPRAGWLTERHTAYLSGLPEIIALRLGGEEYLFVHAGLDPDAPLCRQEVKTCLTAGAFAERGFASGSRLITGHWPVANYDHSAPRHNPVIDAERRLVSIDGGLVVKADGQLNALIITGGGFSYVCEDDLPEIAAPRDCRGSSGATLNLTWLDRFVEPLGGDGEFKPYRHAATGRTIELPDDCVWREGELWCANGTDFRLAVRAGEPVKLVREYSGGMFVKKNGTAGWIYK
ncbi:MAG: metallophosphoesterase family protein [Oscillospiraceae bacterium]|jgi:protein phosphatase|nr:metallophosphoesterase family protein [Oscillospiraceae bacterium]